MGDLREGPRSRTSGEYRFTRRVCDCATPLGNTPQPREIMTSLLPGHRFRVPVLASSLSLALACSDAETDATEVGADAGDAGADVGLDADAVDVPLDDVKDVDSPDSDASADADADADADVQPDAELDATTVSPRCVVESITPGELLRW